MQYIFMCFHVSTQLYIVQQIKTHIVHEVTKLKVTESAKLAQFMVLYRHPKERIIKLQEVNKRSFKTKSSI